MTIIMQNVSANVQDYCDKHVSPDQEFRWEVVIIEVRIQIVLQIEYPASLFWSPNLTSSYTTSYLRGSIHCEILPAESRLTFFCNHIFWKLMKLWQSCSE